MDVPEGHFRCDSCGDVHPVATGVTRHIDPHLHLLEGSEADRPILPSGWWLEDGEASNVSHPNSFFIPTLRLRSTLEAGEIIRIGLVYGPHRDRGGSGHGERLWARVETQHADGRILARLANEPFRLNALHAGDCVELDPCHVIGLHGTSDERAEYPQDDVAVVEKRVLEAGEPAHVVAFAAAPDGGMCWWLLTKEAGDGPVPAALEDLVDRRPQLETPFRAGEGVAAGGRRQLPPSDG